MKTLVLGCNGQLGRSLVETAPDEAELFGFDLPELDITKGTAVLEICSDIQPDVIVNAAAYTAVDKAETETELATRVNFLGPRNIAIASRDVGARLIHISTDFVFEGATSTPYKPNATTRPLSVYGQTKRDGELAVLEKNSDSAAARPAFSVLDCSASIEAITMQPAAWRTNLCKMLKGLEE